MSASLFPGSCRILLGLVSMAAAGSQQAARQLEEAGRKGAWAARGRLKLWGLWGVSQEAGGSPKPSSTFSFGRECWRAWDHRLFLHLLLNFQTMASYSSLLATPSP